MSKERLNVTVDPDVKRQVQARNDINVSGAVNEYLKRRLMGETKDDAILQIQIERLEDQAEDHEQEAKKYRQKAEMKRRELRERREERRQDLQDAVERLEVDEFRTAGAYVKTDDDTVERLANDIDVSPEELRELAIQDYQGVEG